MTKTDPAIRDQAYQFFQLEALDLLQTLEDGLLTLREEFDVPHVHQLMRAAHSIKGGAASVDLPGIQKIAHKLEDVFRALYRREDPLDADLEEALLLAYDCLRVPLVEQIETGGFDADAAWEKAEPVFCLLEAVLQDDMGADVELPTSAELGVDIVHEVFTGDVQRGLEKLTTLLQDPEAHQPIAGEIRATAEVFIGIGDLLGLTGFSAIARATNQALNANPDQAWMIGQLAIECFHASQTAVIGGERTEIGGPSAALLALTESQGAIAEVAQNNPSIVLDLAASQNSLEDVFGQPDLAQDALEDVFGQSELVAQDSLEDVFGMPELVAQEVLEDVFGQLDANAQDALEDVFGQPVLGGSDILESTSVSASEPTEVFENLEDIFGQSLSVAEPSLEVDWAIADQPLPEVKAAPDNHDAMGSELVFSPPALKPISSEATVPAQKAIQPESTRTKAQKQPATTSQSTESVRVDFHRLERLNNLVGELVTQENGALLQSQQLQDKIKRLQQRFVYFEKLSKNLQDWMDQSLYTEVKSQKSNYEQQAIPLPLETSELSALEEFDPLQMDSYSDLYTMVQEAMEELAQMGESMRDMTLITQQAQQTQRKKQQTLKQVRNDLLWARMIPLGDMLNRFPRMVRDMSLKYDKKVIFKQSGTATLVDKAILERLYDPLVHLVRNAFDHGTEPASARLAQGKSGEATIEIRAYHRGNQTFIEVRDDGRGINPDRIRETAIAQGLLDPDAAAATSGERLYQCMFEPSFSTAETISDLSGRGMGLTAVQEQVKTLKGSIAIASEIGQGTTFTIRLPLTLTIAKLLVFSVDGHYMSIPVDTLAAIVTANDADIKTIQGRQFYHYQSDLIPLYPPSAFAHQYPLPRGFAEKPRSMALPQGGKVPLLLISDGTAMIALEVDQILDEQELVIKPFGRAVTAPSYLYGCAILGDGSLVPVVDGSVILNRWQDPTGTAPQRQPETSQAKPARTGAQTILVVDDSMTTRQSITLTLQKFGYHVIQAGDGREGLDKLQQERSIEAVFSDVEMPNMNGFEFLSSCRKTYPASQLPVIMLTSRSGDKHRGIAKLLGANDYLTKPYLEQELINTLKSCLEKVTC